MTELDIRSRLIPNPELLTSTFTGLQNTDLMKNKLRNCFIKAPARKQYKLGIYNMVDQCLGQE